ncbi:MAG: HAD hydrolase-like protein [Spirochaetales bacterium]
MEIFDYNAVLFDFDGVIIDSGADIASAVNSILFRFGYKTLDEKLLISFVGNGARTLLSLTLESVGIDALTMQDTNPQKADFQTFYEQYVLWYEQHAVEKTTLYEGTENLLQSLYNRNIALAVVSNKPVAVTERILAHFNMRHFFDAVIGPESVTHIKPHPESLELAVSIIEKKHGITLNKKNVLMVGDSASDIIAGNAFGCKTCAVTAGLGDSHMLLREKADITLSFAGELCRLLPI